MPKRRRTDDSAATPDGEVEAEPPAPPPERCKKLWFDDGSIVIQAGNTQFKVHRGVLSKHSPVFADLFQIPHPPDEPTVEGCPVVELHDSSGDVEFVLMALYGDQEFINTDGLLDISAVAAIIRLGRKYEMSHLKEEGLRRLQRQFPSRLEDHGNLDVDAYEYIGFDYEFAYESAFSVINLARECSIQTILPALYLETVGFRLDSMLFSSDELPIPYAALRGCIYGREKLLHAWLNRPHGGLLTELCPAKAQCKAAVRPLSKALRKPPPHLAATLWPWKPFLGTWAEVRGLVQGLCKHCQAEFEKTHEKERETLWAALPGHFKLPAWDDLKDFEA